MTAPTLAEIRKTLSELAASFGRRKPGDDASQIAYAIDYLAEVVGVGVEVLAAAVQPEVALATEREPVGLVGDDDLEANLERAQRELEEVAKQYGAGALGLAAAAPGVEQRSRELRTAAMRYSRAYVALARAYGLIPEVAS